MGSLMIEENVVAEAGTVHHLSLEQIRAAISDLGYKPKQRNVHYQVLDKEIRTTTLQSQNALNIL